MSSKKAILYLLIAIFLTIGIAYVFAQYKKSHELDEYQSTINANNDTHNSTDTQDINTGFKDIKALSLPQSMLKSWQLVMFDSENSMKIAYKDEVQPFTIVISDDGTIQDNTFIMEGKIQNIASVDKINNLYRIFIKGEWERDERGITYHKEDSLDYRFYMIDESNGLAYINGFCFMDTNKVNMIGNIKTTQIESIYNKDMSIRQINRQNGTEKLFGTDWFYNDFSSYKRLPNAKTITLNVKDSALNKIKNAPKEAKEIEFRHSFILRTNDNEYFALIAKLKDTSDLNSETLDSNQYGLFNVDNIESLTLYRVGENNTIDLSFGLDVTPLAFNNSNPCMPNNYKSNTFWIYDDGSIYITTIQDNGKKASQTTKRYITDKESLAFVVDGIFLNEDCTMQDACMTHLEHKVYKMACSDKCIVLSKWDINNSLNNNDKDIYLGRFKVLESLNKKANDIQISVFDNNITQYEWIKIDNINQNSMYQDDLLLIPQDVNRYFDFGIAYNKNKKPLIFNFSDSMLLSKLNQYFDNDIFSDINPRSVSEVVTCDKCALFISHSPLESAINNKSDLQFFISSQNIFLANNIKIKQVKESTNELIFEKEGFFGRNKTIDVQDNLGNWIIYMRGKSPQIVKQNKFEDKKVIRYFNLD